MPGILDPDASSWQDGLCAAVRLRRRQRSRARGCLQPPGARASRRTRQPAGAAGAQASRSWVATWEPAVAASDPSAAVCDPRTAAPGPWAVVPGPWAAPACLLVAPGPRAAVPGPWAVVPDPWASGRAGWLVAGFASAVVPSPVPATV